MHRTIDKKDLVGRLEGLLKDFEVIGPAELPSKGIFYEPITNAGDLYLGSGFTTEPVKRFFLNPSEWLFEARFESGNNLLEEIPPPKGKRIIIGARPCEARGLTLLDKVFDPSTGSGSNLSGVEGFDSEYKDNPYINNRKRTIIVGLSCIKPDRTCFCTSLEGSPVESRGMDAILHETEKGFVLEIVTDKGKDIFGSLGQDLSEDEIKSWQIDKEKRENLVKAKIKIAKPEILDKIFESDYWEKVSLSCLSCGICTYLCPTCHCFDLVDEKRRKLRCYDGCAFSDFTLEASGVNPRPSKKERYRQRAFHKFNYFKKNFGENLCVGCGRCIRYCPVKIDISSIVDKAPV